MTDGLFNPEAFEQMPGQMSIDQSEQSDSEVIAFPIQRIEAEVLLRAIVFCAPSDDEGERRVADRLLQRLKLVTGIGRS